MMLGRVLTLVLGGAVLGASMQAQEREKKLPTGGPAMEMIKPAPQMEKRKWVVGRWNVTEMHEKSDWSPGGIGKGTSVVALGPGGHSQIITYNSTGPTGKFSGHGIIAWDPEAKVYRSAWTDSMTPGILLMDCREEGKDWVCFGESVMHGKKIAMRSRSIAPTPAGWTEVVEMSTDGGPFIKMRTFEFNRTSDSLRTGGGAGRATTPQDRQGREDQMVQTTESRDAGRHVFVKGVHGVRYQVKDVARSVAFYTQHLGFKLERQQLPAFANVSLGDAQILLSGPGASGSRPMPSGQQQKPGGWNRVVLKVADLPGFIAELKKAGLRFRNEMETGPGGRQIQIEDSDGNPIELFEPAR